MKKLLVGFILMVLLSSMTLGVLAQTSSELTNERNNLQDVINQKKEEQENIQADLSETQKELLNLDIEIDAYESEILQLNSKIKSLEASISENEKKLEVAAVNYQKQEEMFTNMLVEQYKAGNISYLEVLINSESLVDLISNYYLVSKIATYTEDLMNKIETEKLKIETAKQLLEGQKQSLDANKKSKETAAASLENSKVVKNNYINELNAEDKALQEEIKSSIAEQARIDAEIAALSSKGDGTYSGGTLLWPVPYTKYITATFEDPDYYKTWGRIHKGIDISDGGITGKSAIAVADGTIIKSAVSGDYGNFVVVDHGNGLTTLYAHGTARAVKVGDKVKAGDTVLYIGSTGLSSGPHLHFEVRINDVKKNPLEYVRR